MKIFKKNVETITSVDICSDAITWIHIQNDGLILDWNLHEINKDLINSPDFNIGYEYVIISLENLILKKI